MITLGGWTELNGNTRSNPTISVEVLDLERKCWYSIERLSLPKVFTTMKWQSACICGTRIYIAAQHDDPNFQDTVLDICQWRIDKGLENDPGITAYDMLHDGYNPDSIYQYTSMFCCSVDTLLQTALETFDGASTSTTTAILWQPLNHPHPAVYGYYHNNYDKCSFTLASINSRTLIAVGCDHIKSTTIEEMASSLYVAYKDYRDDMENQDEFRVDDDSENDHVDSESICMDGPCHIYVYDMENDSWNLVTSTPDNGSPDDQASVAVISSSIVIIRNSTTVHICTLH